ncbi:MAG: DNA-binding protein [Gammaproteobacteria bacterium]|nr:DNA-binding protein [Gammaproteobacteria bacterium]
MTKKISSTGRTKDPVAIKIGKRIAQARKMAGFKTAKALRQKLPEWPENRLPWYEAGYSMPHPADIEIIARITDTSACWIMFGLGPIGSGERDLQAVRHQNLVFLFREASDTSAENQTAFLSMLRLEAEKLAEYINNPFKHIGERLARMIEKAGVRPRKWLDEQHVESDGLCGSFPDDLRELMTLYSEMDGKGRAMFIAMGRTISEHR